MKARLLLLVSTLFLSCAAEKQKCIEEDGCALHRNPDTISLLQSRPKVELSQVLKPSSASEPAGSAEVHALPKVNSKGTIAQQMQSEMLTRQLWARAIQSGWSAGIAAVLFVGIIYILRKLRLEKQERLEKRVHEVLCPHQVMEGMRDDSQEPQKSTRSAFGPPYVGKKIETSAFGAPQQQEDNGGVNSYFRGLPKAVKNQLEERLRSARTSISGGETSAANSDKGDAQSGPQQCAAY